MLYYITYSILDILLATSIWTLNKSINGFDFKFDYENNLNRSNNNNSANFSLHKVY